MKAKKEDDGLVGKIANIEEELGKLKKEVQHLKKKRINPISGPLERLWDNKYDDVWDKY